MIKLERLDAPAFLTSEEEERLADAYASSGASVWGHAEIVERLSASSHGKCAYCEAKLGRESHYLEVDHFQHKDKYSRLVAKWSNLLPSCRRCNGTKRSHDVVTKPIINPFNDEPKAHFSMKLYRYRHKTSLGLTSIDVLDLNNSARAVYARYEIGEALHEKLIQCHERLANYKETQTTRRRNLLLSLVRAVLSECQPSASYSATAATILHRDESYLSLVSELIELELWDDDLEILHQHSKSLSLEDS
ncbi:HNH endonuclease [Rhizobium rhizogenes]|uniref:HNH endonuclease n=1 Tax=Rhizobium rhizogenes TaxID=359 RepID=UPI0009F19F13|nr:HNH endonuclease [Rhizobium rhizogenes]NTI26984.1 HNH endonuclease [Rhizobium rhizogenes]